MCQIVTCVMQGNSIPSGGKRNADSLVTILKKVTCDNHSWKVSWLKCEGATEVSDIAVLGENIPGRGRSKKSIWGLLYSWIRKMARDR